VHDFEHGGLTNDFLVNSLDLLAVRYNDRSPLENHHLAAAFTLMRQPEYDFLGSAPKAEFDKLRKVGAGVLSMRDGVLSGFWLRGWADGW
jgi:hypothetical protein